MEMNKYAKEIGLPKSHFVNSSGLPAEGHVMTARELAILANFIIQTYPEYYPYFGEKTFVFGKWNFTNRNPLVFEEALGVDGLKTGFIEEAGYGLVASAEREGQRVILVVNGLTTKKEREEEPRKLLEWGFKSFKPFRLFDQGERVSDALVWGGEKHYVPLVGDGNIDMILPVEHERQGDGADRVSGADQGADPQGRPRGAAQGHRRRHRRNQRHPAFCRRRHRPAAISPCAG